MIPHRKKRNSSRVNLTISVILHAVIVLGSVFLAAREGMLGKTMNKIAVVMVPKDKPVEKPKVKEPEQKAKAEEKQVKPETAKVTAPPPAPTMAAPPPAVTAAAPPPAELPAFDFNDGAKVKQSDSPTEIYKGLVENTIRQRWMRPDNISDREFVAEVEVMLDGTGRMIGNVWKKGSGDKRWDDSVRKALSQTAAISRPPPKDFPNKFLVRFDVQVDTEPLLSASIK